MFFHLKMAFAFDYRKMKIIKIHIKSKNKENLTSNSTATY